ncbi:universal stress protein [Gloeocapsa sp. PCC 73106]|uniref:universal stress protein n=1 Tax=Gloeocapsa sp. PCC 73106 TaxID=102232 RepID=UPI0002ACE970|nr:universal stress protein [Gloeocapsa sp. PCC 73106]ELR99447.1 universal stress protein UspA-like protein [Gloeocapsa sp. PCC 73106]
MSKTCLICTDFTDGLDRLTEFVPDLAQSNLGHIIFFHSVSLEKQGQVPREDSKAIKEAETRLATALNNVPEHVKVSIEVLSGNPAESIERVLENYMVDLIMLGTPIRSGWKETIFGSTSTAIAKLTEAPLLIIRPQLISTYTREELSLRCQHLLRYLLIPYDDGENSHYMIKHLVNHLNRFPDNKIEQCMLVFVVEEVSRSQELTANNFAIAQAKIEEVQRELESVGLKVNTEVRYGEPVAETLKAAVAFDISAIAIANDYQTNLLQWTVPNFAKELLHRSWFPLLFFSPKR